MTSTGRIIKINLKVAFNLTKYFSPLNSLQNQLLYVFSPALVLTFAHTVGNCLCLLQVTPNR